MKDGYIFNGSQLKFKLDVECAGFDIQRDDISLELVARNGSITIPKEKLVQEDGAWFFTFDSASLGPGEVIMKVTAYVPDGAFEDGLRKEVYKQPLCKIHT